MADFFARKDSKYGEGVLLDEYNGSWSIVSAREGKDGKVYMEWMYPQKRGEGAKGPMEKSLPWKISFGSKEEMVATLRNILNKLSDEKADTSDGVPF